MAIYTKDELRKIFQTPFNRESWKAILHNLFRADMIRTTSEKFTDDDDPEEGYYMGALNTADSFRIGLFYYKISSGSVAHKRVGLRNLVCKFINESWGEFDAAIVVFNDGIEWRLSFVCDIKDVATTPKRFTYVFGEHDNFYRTPVERFYELQSKDATFETIRDTFSVDALSDDFFNAYRELYADFVQYITGKRYVKESNRWVERELSEPNYQFESTFDGDEKLVRDYIKKMFGRIVFLYFLQRKGWLNGDRQYMHNLYYNSDQKDNFLDGVLETLFFEVLNTDKPYRTDAAKALPGSENIPYLNGGLFAQDDIDLLDCIFPEDYFKKLFDFLDSYNFTIDENDAEDAEIGIDPEMLGRIFENLLEDNKDKGAFYTPKEIVNYMCKESIIAYLQDNRFTTEGNALIRQFVETFDDNLLSKDQRIYIKDKLKSVKICDPAIGSGAFPMGMVNVLSKLYAALNISIGAAEIKRHIMEQSIYGVDIEKGAVDIARLRFWLAMIVEEKEPMPLPNLHFKIMQGNSLLESCNGVDLSDLTQVNQQQGLFDSTNSEREDLLINLRKYYGTSDHAEREQRFTRIIRNVRRQIYAKNPNISQENFDPSENSDFFLWHTWFADVFEQGGFDIVIGNPPYGYLFKEASYRNLINQKFKVAEYKVDAYPVFAELGYNLLKNGGTLSFITPYTFVSGVYFSKFRDFLKYSKLSSFVLLGKKIFEAAEVDTAIFQLKKDGHVDYVNFCDLRSCDAINQLSDLSLIQISYNDFFAKSNEVLLTATKSEIDIYLKLYSIASKTLSDSVTFYHGVQTRGNGKALTNNVESAESMPLVKGADFYRFKIPTPSCYITFNKENIKSGGDISFYDVNEKLVIRTTADRIVASLDCNRNIVLNSVNVAIPKNSALNLRFILGIMNSHLMEFWYRMSVQETAKTFAEVKIVYLDRMPICIADVQKQNYISNLVDSIFADRNNKMLLMKLEIAVYQLYGLSYDEICIIDSDFEFSEEEYNSFTF